MSLAVYSSETNKPLLLNKRPVSIKPPSNVFEIKKPPEGLNRAFTVCLCEGRRH